MTHNYRSVNTRNKVGIQVPWLLGKKSNSNMIGLWTGYLIGWTMKSGKRIRWMCFVKA